MDEERCTLFTFMNGNTFAAALHIICGLSAWCCPVFPLFSALLFLLERNTKARVACIHTSLISLAVAVLALVPFILWLIIRAIAHSSGIFYGLCTVMFAAAMLLLAFVLLIVEVTCGIKSLKNEPVNVPVITPLTAKIAGKIM